MKSHTIHCSNNKPISARERSPEFNRRIKTAEESAKPLTKRRTKPEDQDKLRVRRRLEDIMLNRELGIDET